MNFSVVIPTFNRRATVEVAIESVFTQGIHDSGIEVIVIDDASTDGTVEWIEATYAGRPVRVLPNSGQKGPAGGRNTGLQTAQGEFVALLDSDDAFLPGHLIAAAAAFERFPSVDVIFGRAKYERNGVPEDYMGPNFERKLSSAPKQHDDASIAVFTPGFFTHLLQYGCWFNLSTVVLRRNAAAERMNEQLRISEDYEFWVRLARNHGFACLKQPQISYTLHDENISFEAAGSAAEHAPRLLQALRIIRDLPRLSSSEVGLIDDQMSEVLFDWAYRCQLRRQWIEAASLHLKSMLHGRRMKNLVALSKLPLRAAMR